MRALLVALLAAVALTPAANAIQVSMLQGMHQARVDAAFAIACHLSKYTCEGITSPRAVYSLEADSRGVSGMYWAGDPNVIIAYSTLGKTPAFQNGVLVHEVVHYLQAIEGRNVLSPCEKEAEAWEVFNIFQLKYGDVEEIVADWEERYPACT